MTLVPLFPADYPGSIVVPANLDNVYSPADHGGVPNKPRAFIIHTPEEDADDNEVTPRWFQGYHPASRGSTHYYLDNDGDVYQCVPESWGAIANGLNGKPRPVWADAGSLNWQTLSVEVEGRAASIGQTMPVDGAQFNALVKLIKHRCAAYKIPLDRDHIMGHYQLAVDRSDPGTTFPWAALMAALEDEMRVAAWWSNRSLGAGPPGTINLYQDFGPGKVYDMRLVMAPDSTGSITFRHGQHPMTIAGLGSASQRTASFLLIAGQFGTAEFTVNGVAKVASLACAGVIP